MTVEQGLRGEFHDRPKVLARALRAVREQSRLNGCWDSIRAGFIWRKTKEGVGYWSAICDNDPHPDQYLPEGYVDVEDEVERSLPYMVGLLPLQGLDELDSIILDLNSGRITLTDFAAIVWNKAYTLGRIDGYECNAKLPTP